MNDYKVKALHKIKEGHAKCWQNEPELLAYLAEAQVYATLAVVDELRKQREDND